MRKVTLYSALSLDGFIARTDGNVDWLHHEAYHLAGIDFGYQAFYDSIGTTLQGNKTYQQVLGFDVPFPYQGKTNYVFSRSPQPTAEHVTFVNEDPATFVEKLKKENGGDIWLIGGGQLNGRLLQAGLIDELDLTLIPAALGEGIALFGNLPMDLQHFKLQEQQAYANGFVQLRYSK